MKLPLHRRIHPKKTLKWEHMEKWHSIHKNILHAHKSMVEAFEDFMLFYSFIHLFVFKTIGIVKEGAYMGDFDKLHSFQKPLTIVQASHQSVTKPGRRFCTPLVPDRHLDRFSVGVSIKNKS